MNIYHKTRRRYSLLIMQEIFISCIGWWCVQRVIKGMYAQRWLDDESKCSTKGYQMHLFDSPPLQLPWSIKPSAANTYHSSIFSFKESSLNAPFSRSPSWYVKYFGLSPFPPPGHQDWPLRSHNIITAFEDCLPMSQMGFVIFPTFWCVGLTSWSQDVSIENARLCLPHLSTRGLRLRSSVRGPSTDWALPHRQRGKEGGTSDGWMDGSLLSHTALPLIQP